MPAWTVTSSGLVATTGGTLAAGSYTATGTTSDVSGDTGTWTYTLYVGTAGTIVQTGPTSGTVTTTGSATFTDQLAVTGNTGTVTYTQSTGGASLTITSLPATNAAVVLTVAITASSGTKEPQYRSHSVQRSLPLTLSSPRALAPAWSG